MARYHNTKEARHWKKECIIRDDYTCQICGSSEKLQVHHIESARYNPELRYIVSNGVTLCKKCHFTMLHILYKGGTRKKTTKKDYRRFRAIAKWYMKIGSDNQTLSAK